MAEEGIRIEGEAESSSQSPQVQQEKYEEKARAKGWKPLDEYKGDEADWVPAKEFLGREKLFDKIHDLKNQLSRQAQRFEQDMAKIQQNFAQVQATEFRKAKMQLEAELKVAKADGDVERAVEVAGEIKEVEQQQKVAAQQAKQAAQAARNNGPTPEFQEWQNENKWFTTDAEMTADAVAIGSGYAAAHPEKSQKDVLEYVSGKIKKMYPEKFDSKPNGKGKVEDNRVEGGGSTRPVSKKSGKLSTSDLTDMEREVMKTLIKRGALKERAAKNKVSQEEQYLNDLSEAKARGQ